jgi:hypothetical protein
MTARFFAQRKHRLSFNCGKFVLSEILHTTVKRLCVDCDDGNWGVVSMLSGKIAVVTGSTSGIGPGISITSAVLPIDGGRTTH